MNSKRRFLTAPSLNFRSLGYALLVLLGVSNLAHGDGIKESKALIDKKMSSQLHEVDRLSVQLMRSPQIQSIHAQVKDSFLREKRAEDPSNAKLIDPDIDEAIFAGVQVAVNEDPLNPRVGWVEALPHHWADLAVPGARYGLENPDNVYLHFPVDGQSRYEIVGYSPAKGPSDLTFSLLTGFYQETTKVKTLDLIDRDHLKIEPDGRFVIAIDSDPDSKTPNHLRTTPEARVVIVRQTMGNWNLETPLKFYVRRIGPSAAPASKSIDQQIQRADEVARKTIQLWAIDLALRNADKVPVNTMGPIRSSGAQGGLVTQMTSQGKFKLADDEALIIKTRQHDAKYISFMLLDSWMVSTNYAERLGSLNHEQVVQSDDGTITYVVSKQDPGVHNWIDTSGLHEGYLCLRLQHMSGTLEANLPAPEVRLAKLSELRSLLPSDTRFVTASERNKQLADRINGYRLRVRSLLGFGNLADY